MSKRLPTFLVLLVGLAACDEPVATANESTSVAIVEEAPSSPFVGDWLTSGPLSLFSADRETRSVLLFEREPTSIDTDGDAFLLSLSEGGPLPLFVDAQGVGHFESGSAFELNDHPAGTVVMTVEEGRAEFDGTGLRVWIEGRYRFAEDVAAPRDFEARLRLRRVTPVPVP